MPAPWWKITEQAARDYNLDPYWIAAVMAIESRFKRYAHNRRHKCYGLMQLQRDTARSLGVTDPYDPKQNIGGGAAVLARLDKKCRGNKRRILKKYNPTDTGAYSREVMRAWRQARGSS
jgi:soluble lytic murein transglycosylase-like protein